MNRAQTQVYRQRHGLLPMSEFRTAVSLHSHTYHSKEKLDFLPHYIHFHQIPVISRLIQGELKRHQQSTGRTVDFDCAYWTPPVTPAMVLESESAQILKLGLQPLVSITDHDSIAAPLSLNAKLAGDPVPISLEWSIPFGGNCFHLGVHHLPADGCNQIVQDLAHYTAHPQEQALGDLLARLDSFPEILLVLNHPCCNFVRVDAARHRDSLHEFLRRHGSCIHGLELNGMRPWNENQNALHMAEEYDLPIVAGGDRHGCRPNTMLNLTAAESWGEFVAQVRSQRRNSILVLAAYEEPIRLRELATAGDVLRRYPRHPYGQRRYTDRIFVNMEGYSWHPLSFYWDGGDGKPRWLQPVVNVVIALGSDRLRPILRRFLSLRSYDSATQPLGKEYGSAAMTAQAGEQS